MSYDISVFKRENGATAAELADRDEAARPAFTPDELKRLASATQAVLPQFAYDADEQENLYEFTNKDSGLKIEMLASGIGFALPYWHDGADARAVFTTINAALSAMSNTMPIVVYDPQQAREINPALGLSDSEINYYTKTTTHVQEIMANPSPAGSEHAAFEREAARRPWWKFW